MVKMSKSEFMSRYINDRYKKQLKERKISNDTNDYIFTNMQKIKKRTKSLKKISNHIKDF